MYTTSFPTDKNTKKTHANTVLEKLQTIRAQNFQVKNSTSAVETQYVIIKTDIKQKIKHQSLLICIKINSASVMYKRLSYEELTNINNLVLDTLEGSTQALTTLMH